MDSNAAVITAIIYILAGLSILFVLIVVIIAIYVIIQKLRQKQRNVPHQIFNDEQHSDQQQSDEG